MTTANELPVIQLVSFALSGPLSVESVYRRIEPLLDRFEISSPSIARLSLRSALDSTFRLPPISIARRAAYLVAATKRIADTLARGEAYDVKAETALAAAVGRESEYSDALVIEFKSVRTPAGVAKYKAPIGTPIVGGVAQVNPVGHIPEADWLKGQAEWKAKGEAIWKANEWKPHAHSSLAPPSAHKDLLAARSDARTKFPVGHPERVAAERAVRQSRKAGAEEAPGIVSSGDPVADHFKNAIAESDDLLRQTGAKVPPKPVTPQTSNRLNRHGTPDKRIQQGQTPSNFVYPDTSKPMSKSSIGDTYEELFKVKGSQLLVDKFGGDYRVISHASGGARNTPLDFQLGDKYGGELKTLSKLAKNQKTAIKAEEVERKLKALADKGLDALLTVQVVDQSTGHVDVYTHDAFASKKVSTMLKIGSYEYTKADFNDALQRAGYSGRTPDAMAERLEGGEEYERLLKARLTAKKSYPAGHPERLKAEKAVRDARKRIHGGGEEVARAAPTPRAAPVSRVTSSSTKNLSAGIHHAYRWSANPSINSRFKQQAETAINRQIDHQASKLPHPLLGDTRRSINVSVTGSMGTGTARSLGSYGGSSIYGDLRLHPRIFPHQVMNSSGDDVMASFHEANNSPTWVLEHGKTVGWWVPTDAKWTLSDNVIAHEIGHGVNDSVFDRSGEDQGIPDDSEFWIGFAKTFGIRPPKPEIRYTPNAGPVLPDKPSVTGKNTYTHGTTERWMKANKDTIADAVSDYGSSKPHELFAEMWAEYTLSSNPRPPAKFYGDYVTKLLTDKAAGSAQANARNTASVVNFDPEGMRPGSVHELPYAQVTRLSTGEWVVRARESNGTLGGHMHAKSTESVKKSLGIALRYVGGRSDANEAPPASAHVKALADLRLAEASGKPKVSDPVGSGAMAETHVETYPNGSKWIHKQPYQAGDLDKEELAGKISDILGAGAPAVIRGDGELRMPFVEGELPVLRYSNSPERTQKEITDEINTIAGSKQGKLIGLLDLITDNGDRNEANWIIKADGTPVPIDHGYSWSHIKASASEIANARYASPFIKTPMRWIASGRVSMTHELLAGDFTSQQLRGFQQELEKLAADPSLSAPQQGYMKRTLQLLEEFMRGGDSAINANS